MPTWLHENHIEGEINEVEFIQKVEEEMLARIIRECVECKPGNYGNDGFITIYQEEGQHRGKYYDISVLRYFSVHRKPNNQFPLRYHRPLNDIGKHVIIEGKGIHAMRHSKLSDLLDLSEYLWHDTLHFCMEDWTLRRQWEYAEARAREDCELNLKAIFNQNVANLRKELRKCLSKLGNSSKLAQN